MSTSNVRTTASGTASSDVPVVIVGGGAVGLTMALLLADLGVRPLLVERHAGTSIHPRARGLNVRTMEIFRGLGLEAAIRSAGAPLSLNRYMLWVEALAGRELRRVPLDQRPTDDALHKRISPTDWAQCAQDELEPILVDAGRRRGAELRFGAELTDVDQQANGVTATFVDRADGRTHRCRAAYLVAADGSASGLRSRLGVGQSGFGDLARNVNIYFRADLRRLVHDRHFVLCFVENPAVKGLLLSVDNRERWILNVPVGLDADPTAGLPLARCLDLVRGAVGVPDLPVEILSVLPWTAAARVADRFSVGRCFLVGDAAHVMPPAGALGMNTGIQDAHNLAWKLAAVLHGGAGVSLLATYDSERRPIAALTVDQAVANGERRFVHLERQRAAGDGEVGRPVFGASDLAVTLGYWYASSAVVDPMPAPPDLAALVRTGPIIDGRPGSRLPHGELRQGDRLVSTTDLVGRNFVLLAGRAGEPWCAAARRLGTGDRRRIDAYHLGPTGDLTDDGDWAASVGIGHDGAVLVRPDGFVAWRTGGAVPDHGATLRGVLDRVLGRS